MSHELKNKIMRRIYIIWFFRKIAPAVLLEIPFLFFIAFYEAAREFFVAQIIYNLKIFAISSNNSFWASFQFTQSALANTAVIPLVMIGISGILAMYLTFVLIKNLRMIFGAPRFRLSYLNFVK